MWGFSCTTGELRQGAGSGDCRDSSICGMQGSGQPPSLLLSGAAFPAWAAARPLPLPVAPAEGPCPHRGHRPGEGLNGNLMAGLPEIAKPLGKAAPPRAGKAEASFQLSLSCVRSQLLPSPEYFHVVEQHRVPDTHFAWLMVSPHPPYPQPWETNDWGLAADADASASHSLPGHPGWASTPARQHTWAHRSLCQAPAGTTAQESWQPVPEEPPLQQLSSLCPLIRFQGP